MLISTIKIKEKLNNFLLKIHILPLITALRVLKILEIDYGHFKSVYNWRALDRSGSHIPWFTYPSIDYLKSLDLSKMVIFEYGSGYSTLFWAKKAKLVVSVENNRMWFSEISKMVAKRKNVKLLLMEKKEDYVTSLTKNKSKFDLIIIDGLYRKSCIKPALNTLNKKGIIILDNSERYPKICSHLRSEGLIQIDFNGFSPINPYISRTSLFISRHFLPTFSES